MKVLLGLVLVLVAIVLVAIVVQELRYLRIRRNLAMDRQALFHLGSVFHVTSLLKLGSNQELLDGVRDFVSTVERDGAEVVYAGKVVVNGRTSSQLPSDDWDAIVLTQYPSRAAWDGASASIERRDLESRFENVYSLGMKRSAGVNLAIPVALLRERVLQLVRREPPRYPFHPVSRPLELNPNARERIDAFRELIQANLEYSREALVIVNFAKQGTREQRKANAGYGGQMFGLFAETGAGPMHLGKAVAVEGDVDFDQVIIVFYPGLEFFVEMVGSDFYQGIFPGKQLGDDLSSLTVPLLSHL